MKTLEEMKAYIEKATEGPLTPHYCDHRGIWVVLDSCNEGLLCFDGCDQDANDATFVANARTDLPLLLEFVEWITEQVDSTVQCNDEDTGELSYTTCYGMGKTFREDKAPTLFALFLKATGRTQPESEEEHG